MMRTQQQNPEHNRTYVLRARGLYEFLICQEDDEKPYITIYDREDLERENIGGGAFVDCEEEGVFYSEHTGICILGRGGHSAEGIGGELFYIKPVNSGRSNAGGNISTEFCLYAIINEDNGGNDGSPVYIYSDASEFNIHRKLRERYVEPALHKIYIAGVGRQIREAAAAAQAHNDGQLLGNMMMRSINLHHSDDHHHHQSPQPPALIGRSGSTDNVELNRRFYESTIMRR